MPILGNSESNFYSSFFKPLMDLLFSTTAIIVFSPLLLSILIALTFHFKGKPLFIQKRAGFNERIFKLYKFRSFLRNGDNKSITKFGRFLRITSMDELPQLFNILLGNISLVGPRPLLPEYLGYYDEAERKRHLVKPGLTGLSQIKTGNSSDWTSRLKYDVDYVKDQSFLLDLKIILSTIKKILSFERRKEEVEIELFSEFAKRR